MKAYGEVAVAAVGACLKLGHEPRMAWNTAAKNKFPSSSSLQSKSCPRSAFLGLCAAHEVRGVKADSGARQLGKNARYALYAVKVLREKRFIEPIADELWREVGAGKAYNSQMDVVLALWKNRLIEGS